MIFFHVEKWLGHWEPWTTIFSIVWSIARPINSGSNFYPVNRLSVCGKDEWITRGGKRKDESLPSPRDFISFCFILIIIHDHKDKNWTTKYTPVYPLPLPLRAMTLTADARAFLVHDELSAFVFTVFPFVVQAEALCNELAIWVKSQTVTVHHVLQVFRSSIYL